MDLASFDSLSYAGMESSQFPDNCPDGLVAFLHIPIHSFIIYFKVSPQKNVNMREKKKKDSLNSHLHIRNVYFLLGLN